MTTPTDGPGDLEQWRRDVLGTILYAVLALGTITYVPSAVFAFTDYVKPLFVVNTIALAGIAWITFDRRLSYRVRVLSLLGTTYGVGVLFLILVGPVSQIYLLAFPVLTGILLGVRSALFALALNGVTVFGVGFLADADFDLPGLADTSLYKWFVIALNFMFISGLLTLAASVLLHRLETSLAAQTTATASLRENEREVVATNVELKREIAEREQAQEEMQRLMAEERQLSARLRHAEKLEAMGTMAAGIAHDFNNIVGLILAAAEAAREEEGHPRGHLDSIIGACDRAKNVVRQMLQFSRAAETDRVPIQLGPVIEETIPLLRAALGTRISLRHHVAHAGYVLASPSEIQQVLLNLATNAADAMVEVDAPVLTIGLERLIADASGVNPPVGLRAGVSYVKLTVADNGSGISPEIQSRMFDPFYTTKGPQSGTGLGLASVHGIVAALEGEIAVNSRPGRGATFEIFLPEAAAPEADGPSVPQAAAPPGGARILVVDDEPAIRRYLGSYLKRLGYRVVEAEDGEMAREIFDRAPEEIDLVLTDLTMPRVGGVELIHHIRGARPETAAILTTGFGDERAQAKLDSLGGVLFLQKPYTRQGLTEIVALALARR